MSSGVDVMEYDSMQDLEDTIDEVYSDSNRLNKEMRVFMDQAQKVLEYRHDPEILKASAEYVEQNLPDESQPDFVEEYARKQLENPEKAENWSKLQDAQKMTEGLADQFQDTYEGLWDEFGYSGDKLHEKIEGSFPVATFLRTWEDRPYELFLDQENYDERNFSRTAEGSRPTMARFFDIDSDDLSLKQRDDLLRGEELEVELNKDNGRSLEDEERHNFWRNQFVNSQDSENPRSSARWVNKELMMLENTLDGTPAPFRDEKAEASTQR